VFGVSADSVESHKKFRDEYQLPFPLLADPEKKTISAYGAWGEKKMMGRTYMGIKRMSYLVDPEGVIRKIYEHVKPEVHAEEVLADLKELSA
jgi:peroxiredoxin Q/BCP